MLPVHSPEMKPPNARDFPAWAIEQYLQDDSPHAVRSAQILAVLGRAVAEATEIPAKDLDMQIVRLDVR